MKNNKQRNNKKAKTNSKSYKVSNSNKINKVSKANKAGKTNKSSKVNRANKSNKANYKNKNEEKNAKVNINWFPGHMAKAMRQIEADLKLVDIVIELLDARIPLASQNPEIANKIQNKKTIIILNKADLADERSNEKWVSYFKNNNIPAILVNSNNGKGIDRFMEKMDNITCDIIEKNRDKGRVGKKVRAMVLGIPNVGKSSFINRIAKSTKAEVRNKPGVTQREQWIRLNDKIELLDTPGVLWPKFENEDIALKLSFTGTIKETVIEKTEIAYQLVKFLLENYPEKLMERYNLTEEYISKTLNQDQPENVNIYEIILEIGQKRGCIISGGNVDEEKVSKIILDEFKNGKLGRITLENPKV